MTQTFLILILTPFCISYFNQDDMSLGDCIALARPYIIPALGFSILSGLGIGFGMLLFLIPGILFMVMWAVGIPALVTESLDVSSAFDRSANLTSGYRWWVLLVLAIVAIIGWIGGIVASIFIGGVGGVYDNNVSAGNFAMPPHIITAAATALLQMLNTAIVAASTAALYYELRHIKEGLAPKAIASVFD